MRVTSTRLMKVAKAQFVLLMVRLPETRYTENVYLSCRSSVRGAAA